ncbi:hypothetical protein HID58_067272, partial [Brassica napus]
SLLRHCMRNGVAQFFLLSLEETMVSRQFYSEEDHVHMKMCMFCGLYSWSLIHTLSFWFRVHIWN